MSERLMLGDVVVVERGVTYKSSLLDQPGPVLLGLGSIARNGGFRSDSLRTYGGDSPEKLLVYPGEIYASLKDVTQTADLLGAVARVPVGGPVGRLTQDTVRLEVVREGFPAGYLYWVLRTPQYRSFCRSRATGTTTMGLPRRDFLSFSFPGPTRTRMAIVEVLEALDDRIAANERVIAATDELARLRYRSVAEREVPLSSLARFVNGRAFTKDATGTGRVVVRIAELNSGVGASTVYNDLEVPDDNLARPGDLLFAWSGSLTVARWYRPEAIVNQHIFKVIPNDDVPMWLVNQAVRAKLDEFRAVAADKATTMGHIQRRHLDQPVAIPAPGAIKELDGVMDALWQRALAGEVENLSLVRTRDELLPLLMSGRLRVKGAERAVEEVV